MKRNLAKKCFIFDILRWSPTSNLGSLSLLSTSNSIYELDSTSIGFALIVLYVLLYFSAILFNLPIHTLVIYLQILFFKISINVSASTNFLSICVECISISLYMILLTYCKIYLYFPIFSLTCDWIRLKLSKKQPMLIYYIYQKHIIKTEFPYYIYSLIAYLLNLHPKWCSLKMNVHFVF